MAKIKIFTEKGVNVPVYKTKGSVGFDIESNEDIIIKPGERKLIHTGLYMEIPAGYELQVRPRSGLSLKDGFVTILGTIDNDYRGEIGVIGVNINDTGYFQIDKGDRIAQGVLAPIEIAKFEKVNSIDELSKTDRGTDGFGSTGV